MLTNKLKKVSSSTGLDPLYVDDVFSTYLYEGNGSTQTITNGIDLVGEGGLVWGKVRSAAGNHKLTDTERGTNSQLSSNTTSAEATSSSQLTSFNSDGFSVGSGTEMNGSGYDMVSWTFRKAPKFFDVVTYTGDGIAGRTIAHNLGTTVGCIVVKQTDISNNWAVYHRGTTTPQSRTLYLNYTDAESVSNFWDNTSPTESVFSVGSSDVVNGSGNNYVAYIFAHNDGDGGFGEGGDEDIIKCGSYSGTNVSGNFIDLGFEPQYLIIKRASGGSANWLQYDSMRGLVVSGNDAALFPNLNTAETPSGFILDPNSTGFTVGGSDGEINASSSTYIYLAIRRSHKPATSGSEVLSSWRGATTSTGIGTFVDSGFPPDMVLCKDELAGASSIFVVDRLRGCGETTQEVLITSSTAAEVTTSGRARLDISSQGWYVDQSNTDYFGCGLKRSKGFFDVVCYSGDGIAGRTVNHNLGVVPEMMWIKRRTESDSWAVYTEATGNTNYLFLDQTNAAATASVFWDNTTPTNLLFTVGNDTWVNTSGQDYIAYLFTSQAGISKVGSYTGNGTTQTIDCGFSTGTRFILIKRTDSSGDWYVWDSTRGIVAGNDPHLSLNITAAEVTSDDSVDPHASGFIVNQVAATNINVSGGEYIFLAIA